MGAMEWGRIEHTRIRMMMPHLREHKRTQTINFIMNVSGGWCAREELGTGVSAASSCGRCMLLNNTPHTSNMKRASPAAMLVTASHHYGCPCWSDDSAQQTERACAARVSRDAASTKP